MRPTQHPSNNDVLHPPPGVSIGACLVTRIYLAGPMTDLPEFNYPAFHAEAARLRALGYDVANPAENPPPACRTWAGYMRLAIPLLCTCDAICLLPGWASSRGASIEHALAVHLGMAVIYQELPSALPAF